MMKDFPLDGVHTLVYIAKRKERLMNTLKAGICAERRQRFQRWLQQHGQVAVQMPLSALLRHYGGPISDSAAYRAAVDAGVRGGRQNRTRYAAFWATINWDLPDTTLHAIWGVTRGNLRQRRLRLGIAAPTYKARLDQTNQNFLLAVARETRRALSYRGPRPH